jgi:hypothetical protein
MSSDNPTPSYPVQSDERVSTVMIYTNDQLVWGEVVTKESIRVSTWLRSSSIPQYIILHNANLVRFHGSGMTKPQAHKEFFLPTNQVLAFHLKPPAMDPLDYDPNEPMRKLSPTTVLIGWFRFDGFIRMSTHTNLDRFLDVGKEDFMSFYDMTITNSAVQTMAAIKTPFALIRSRGVLFSSKDA